MVELTAKLLITSGTVQLSLSFQTCFDGYIRHLQCNGCCYKVNLYSVQCKRYIKGIKSAPECIVELYKHLGIFKNTREVHREARGAAECFSHFSSVFKNSQVLIELNNARGERFLFLL